MSMTRDGYLMSHSVPHLAPVVCVRRTLNNDFESELASLIIEQRLIAV